MKAELLPCIEINPTTPPRTTIIWLHGLGADGHDFEPIAEQLALPPVLGVRFVFPHAPHRSVTINGGFVMRAWYDIASPDLTRGVDESGIVDSRQAIEGLIRRERRTGIDPSRVIVAGFSQGGVIALETAARFPERLGGVIALSAYLPSPAEFPRARESLPVFMGHGTQDPVIPYHLGMQSRTELEGKGYSVEWHSYPMPHSVCWEEIGDLRNWLSEQLEPAAVD